jgi:hypothetical protein
MNKLTQISFFVTFNIKQYSPLSAGSTLCEIHVRGSAEERIL